MAWLLATLVSVPSAAAQGGLPAYAPLNPVAATRTPLRFVPLRPAGERLAVAIALDYGSAVEWNRAAGTEYLLDAEVLRAELAVAGELGRGFWASAALPVRSVHAGLLDAAIDWYHGVLGIDVPEREDRPRNEHRYRIVLEGAAVEAEPVGPLPGDLTLTLARRHDDRHQTALLLVLPTALGPRPYRRGSVGAAVTQTLRVPVGSRGVYEGSVGMGWSAPGGPLARYQNRRMLSATSGIRLDVAKSHAAYVNFVFHTPYYAGTGMRSLDRRETSLDFGWILRRAGGGETRLGLVEDLEPSGAGIDVVLRFAHSF